VIGLTSIHEPSISESDEIKNSALTPDGKKSFEIQARIESLEKRERLLLDNISALERSVSSAGRNRLEVLADVKRIIKQKEILVGEIKKLFEILNEIKGTSDKFTGEIRDFSADQIASLSKISDSIKKDYEKKLDRLKRMSELLASKESFLVDLFAYLEKFFEVCDSDRRANLIKTADIVAQAMDVASQRKEAEKLLKLAQDDRKLAETRLGKVTSYHNRIKEVKDFLNNRATAEEQKLKDKEKDLVYREKILEKTKKVYDIWQDSLYKKEKKLKDKEETLKRSAKRLGVI